MLTEICQINCEDIENSLSVELAFIYLAAPPLFHHCTGDYEQCLFLIKDMKFGPFFVLMYFLYYEKVAVSVISIYLNIAKLSSSYLLSQNRLSLQRNRPHHE